MSMDCNQCLSSSQKTKVKLIFKTADTYFQFISYYLALLKLILTAKNINENNFKILHKELKKNPKNNLP